MSAIAQTRIDIARASRILAHHRVLDGYGHVSARHPERPDRFLMTRSMAPGLATPEDVLELDLDGNAVSQPDAKLFLERFIHSELYKARADVIAVVHSHAPEVVPYTVVPESSLRPICHLSGFLDGVGPAFNVSEQLGHACDQLISSETLGQQFARHFADRSVGLIRAHGFTVVSDRIPAAVFRSVYTVRNCQIDMAARQLGAPAYLDSGDAAACEVTTNEVVGRAWELWLHELKQSADEAWL